MSTHSSSNRTGEVGSVQVEAEWKVSTTDVIIIVLVHVLVAAVTVVDAVDDGKQKRTPV
jgi:hypothetical protein